MKKKKLFSSEEDEMMLSLIPEQNGKPIDFVSVAKHFPGRTLKQVRDRYMNYLSSIPNDAHWSFQEDTVLIKKHFEYGPKWSKILTSLPGKTINGIKNRFILLQKYDLDPRKVPTTDSTNNRSNVDANEMDTREIKSIEETLKPYFDQNNAIQVNNPPNASANQNLSPQSRTNSSSSTQSKPPVSHQIGMEQLSCLQTGDMSNQYFQTTTGSNHPVKVPFDLHGYHIISKLGSGSYGAVVLANKNGDYFALKIIPTDPLKNTPIYENILREIDVLSTLPPHPNVIRYFEHFTTADDRYIVIVTEACKCALWQYMNACEAKKVTRQNRFQTDLEIARGILRGLAHVHANSIVHFDLKIENILIADGKVPKIADFGFATRVVRGAQVRLPGLTIQYAPPEVFGGCGGCVDYFKIDMWAAGVVLYLLASHDAGFYAERDPARIRRRALEVDIASDESDPLQRIAACCMVKDPRKRPVAREILADPLFNF